MRNDSLHRELQQTAEKFAARHLAGIAAVADHTDPRFPEEVFRTGCEAGFDKLILPEDAGGSGLSLPELCSVIERLSRMCAGHAMVFGVQAAALKAIHDAAPRTAEKALESGQPIAIAIVDPDAVSGFESGLAHRKEGDGYRLQGKAGIAVNWTPDGFAIVFSKDAGGHAAAFFVDGKAKGLKAGKLEKTLGLRALTMAEIEFDQAEVAGAELIAEGDAAAGFYRKLFRSLCITAASTSCGVMAEASRKALAYAAERYQGGKIIFDHTHIRNILGGITAKSLAAAGAVRSAAGADDDLSALGAKATVTDLAVKVCEDAVQILGGYGYMRDYGLEKRLRDAATLALLPASNPRIELLIAAAGKGKL